MKINAQWHRENKMPKNPKLEDRIKWHRNHQKNCNCREAPESIKKFF
ncbi:hypothetical protein M1349_00425 [Patescibacteria group bacterium]|nr:hypothetical protein [Patescibacteria group bacterium]